MKYYELIEDVHVSGRWYLCEIKDEQGKHVYYDNEYFPQFTVTVSEQGIPMDFTISDDNFIPIVSEYLMRILVNESNLLFIPTTINDYYGYVKYYTMLPTDIIDCVDEKESKFNKFEVNDPVRPDKAGEYRAFFKLIINKNKAEDKDIFRLAKSENTIIISERMKVLLESKKITGLRFKEV